MGVFGRLVHVVADAKSPTEALRLAARIIAEELHAEECSIFAQRKGTGLELRAHFGPRLTSQAAVAEAAVAEAAVSEARVAEAAVGVAAVAERAFSGILPATDPAAGLVAVPVTSINRAIGAIVARRATTSPFTTEEVMRLSGVASQLVQLVEGVILTEAIGASASAGELAERSTPSPPAGERILRGLAASPGIAIGIAAFRHAFPRKVARADTTYRGEPLEGARARDAFEKTRNDLLKLQVEAASEIGEDQALIFGAHLLMLNDPLFKGLVDSGIAGGRSATIAVDDAFEEIVRRILRVSDPYVQERIEDIEDLRSRILGHLVGDTHTTELDTRLVISPRTTPSLLVELKARGAVGIASELGGVTSHGVVLARSLGIPAVTGVPELLGEVLAGDLIIIDGSEGTAVIRPVAQTRAMYEARVQEAERRRTEFRRFRDRPACTADGVRFDLHANIALGADLEIARENRADGVGLYRTEFPFIVRDGLPTIDEQVRIYMKAYDAFPSKPVTLRLLDLAADKFLPSSGLGTSQSAFHGYRSIRILFDYPHILCDQVQAFAIAAGGRPLRILIPMVTSVTDVVRIKRLIADSVASTARVLSNIHVVYGAMVETAAAVELVADLAREVDFFSIGTNDLIQYTLVVDRDDPRLSSERHSYHPAVLRMIRRVVLAAHGAGKSVTVCGEMAAKPELALALLAMDIDALSVAPRVIPELKRALARMPIEAMRARIDDIIALATEDDVITALRHYIGSVSSGE